ncbi:MAG: DUF4199 family protein [Balneolaceae bacterium]
MQYDSVNMATQGDENDYWHSVLIVGAAFGVVGSLVTILFGYLQISSEPSGALLTPLMIGSVLVRLATCFAGMIAIWHMARSVTPWLTLSRGALIGFLAGGVVVIVDVVVQTLWLQIDPAYTERVLESIIANLEQMNIPGDTREELIDQMAAAVETPSLFSQIFYGIPVTGLLNLLTGMLGIKYFARKPDKAETD